MPPSIPSPERGSAKPRLLDLFCGAGGTSRGYQRAGFHVTGVDIEPQPRFAGDVFIQADAIDYVATHGWKYDAITASPPCQVHTQIGRIHQSGDYYERHIDLIPATRYILESIGLPYVIENVVGAALRNAITLCGSQFGLKVYRHRLFESNFMILAPCHIPHRDQTPSSGHGVSPKGFISVTGNGGAKQIPQGFNYMSYVSMAMGIDWMSRAELSQAIPPAYTEYIGKQLMNHVLYRREMALERALANWSAA